jgi:hypothetical protein
MFDFLKIRKCLQDKDTPNFKNCTHIGTYNNGLHIFHLKGYKPLAVQWYEDSRILRIKGSLPYYFKGHNFTYSQNELIETINNIEKLLCIDLWDADVEAFEFGCVFPVERKPIDYIQNHSADPKAHLGTNVMGKYKGYSKEWENSIMKLKIYDVVRNYTYSKKINARDVIAKCGYNPKKNYMRFELHQKQPHLLNSGKYLLVRDLVSKPFQPFLSKYLLGLYQNSLIPTKTIIQPVNKKDFASPDIMVSVLIGEGLTVQGIEKKAKCIIRNTDCFTKGDRAARGKMVDNILARVQESEESQWDLTENIMAALEAENREFNDNQQPL